MVNREHLITALQHDDGISGHGGLSPDEVGRIADACIRILTSETQDVVRAVLSHAADHIAPNDQALYAGQPWELGFHDGRATAADALRTMALHVASSDPSNS